MRNPRLAETLIDLVESMADYLCDSEREDYFEQCKDKEIEPIDPYKIDVDNLWHIFQTRMYFMFLLNRSELREEWEFYKTTKLTRG
jgi:hypothetical protein